VHSLIDAQSPNNKLRHFRPRRTDGVSRRHHRSPAQAKQPAGQDPGRAHGPEPCRSSDALFAPESQSFLAKVVAGFRHS
jgi:hypothetical protein